MTARRTRTGRNAAVLVAVAAIVAAACGGGDGGGGEGDRAAPGECPANALDGAGGPVEITFWHQLQAENERALRDLVRAFHREQDRVRVKLAYYGEEMLLKYKSGLGTGNLPDVLQIEETQLQAMIDSRGTVPVQACVDASGYALDDFIPRALAYYTVDGTLWSMPWNVSNPVLYYDAALFRAAGLDPADPPETLAEVREYAQQIVDSGVAPHGIALKAKAFFNEFWFAKAGQLYVDQGNGRAGRATRTFLDSDVGRAVWTWWEDMVESGLAIDSGPSEASPDNLLAIANGQAAMTFDGSSGIGPIKAVLESGQFPGVEVGVAAFPGVEAGGGVETAEGSLHIVRGEPEEVAAVWEFVQYLLDPDQLVELHLRTGYVPVRRSVAEDPRIRRWWRENPAFQVPFDQLTEGPETDATAGAVIGDFQGVRDAVEEGLEAMLKGDLTAREALAQAQRQADAAVREYNERLGL